MAAAGIGSQLPQFDPRPQTTATSTDDETSTETMNFNITQLSEGTSETAQVISSANPPALLGGQSESPPVTV